MSICQDLSTTTKKKRFLRGPGFACTLCRVGIKWFGGNRITFRKTERESEEGLDSLKFVIPSCLSTRLKAKSMKPCHRFNQPKTLELCLKFSCPMMVAQLKLDCFPTNLKLKILFVETDQQAKRNDQKLCARPLLVTGFLQFHIQIQFCKHMIKKQDYYRPTENDLTQQLLRQNVFKKILFYLKNLEKTQIS